MGKQLIFIRHAEADSTNFTIKDHERPLTVDGRLAASKLGIHLNKNKVSPDIVICSDATRTVQTAALITEQIGIENHKINLEPRLYEASTRILLNVINGFREVHNSVVLIGHNPSISFLAEYLTGQIIGNLSPSGVVFMDFDNDSWSLISKDTMTLSSSQLNSL